MSRECAICEKKTVISQQRKKLMSRYNPTPRKRKYPNIQTIAVPKNVSALFGKFAGKRIRACTRCIKTLLK